MATNRAFMQCTTCGAKTITRTALTAPYLEFAFPCPNCVVEIRFGINCQRPSDAAVRMYQEKLGLTPDLVPPDAHYVKMINATLISEDETIENVESFDADHLIPLPIDRDFSPFISTHMILGNSLIQYGEDSDFRKMAVYQFWPQLEQAVLHYNRSQWDLFDKVYKNLKIKESLSTPDERGEALYFALELYGRFFRRRNENPYKLIKERINLAQKKSTIETESLTSYFKVKGKDTDLDSQINGLRKRWAQLYSAVGPIFTTHFWNPKIYDLTSFTLAQKRFDELKSFYIDCFETFCRISVIAAGVEGIISTGRAVIRKAKGELSLEQFDIMKNGTKPDILRRIHIDLANEFVPFIDHRLRNGIGHHAARYDVETDIIEYAIENEKGLQRYGLPYILFCEKVVSLYGQLELASCYVHWLRLFK